MPVVYVNSGCHEMGEKEAVLGQLEETEPGYTEMGWKASCFGRFLRSDALFGPGSVNDKKDDMRSGPVKRVASWMAKYNVERVKALPDDLKPQMVSAFLDWTTWYETRRLVVSVLWDVLPRPAALQHLFVVVM